MSDPQARPSLRVERELGRRAGVESGKGTLLVVTAGVHGNEPAGVQALERVFATLEARGPRVKGELVGLSGNRAALTQRTRFHHTDLNRLWSADDVAQLRERDPALDHADQREQRELLGALETLLATPRERVALLDLHSTSGGGPPFLVMGDTLQNRELAFALGVPVLLGLEENIGGTLIEHVGALGHVAVVLEAGQNEDPGTIDRHESAVWLALVALGLVARSDVPDLDFHVARLREPAADLPPVVEVLHRHDIAPEDEQRFRMVPGLESFQSIERGRLLAHVGTGSDGQVLAPFAGVLLMPRYQQKGLDGFFLGRRVEPRWLKLSGLMRRLHLERMLGLLPGVELAKADGNVLSVDPRIARFFTKDLFHLLGYRRQEERDQRLVFTRRVDKL